ncbi:MAG: hypothetical protein WCJ62_00370 [Flavobacterium sp.]
MKKIFYFIILLIVSNSSFGQILKKYSGPFQLENIVDQNAVATYSYNDDTASYKRVKNGLFSLVFKGTGNYHFLGNATVTGNYKNNLKTGKWEIKLDYNNLNIGDLYVSGTKMLVCYYKNGELNGAFLYTSNLTTRTKIYDYKLRKYVYSKPSLPETKKIVATFDKGVVVGNYNYNFNDQVHKSIYSIVASLDSDSILQDKYIETGDGNEHIVEYKNGFRIRNIDKNLQTGEVKIEINEEFTKEDLKFSEYLKAKVTTPDLEESSYNIHYFNGIGNGYERLNEVIGINSDLFSFLNIGGDLTMEQIKDRGLLAFQERTFSH